MLPSPTTGKMLHAVITDPTFHSMFMADEDGTDDLWHITERYMDGDNLVLLFEDQFHADDYDDVASK
jgi:hypothetical protein